MSVWLTIPSARPIAEINPRLKLWKEQGYKVALVRDEEPPRDLAADVVFVSREVWNQYPGYAIAVNALIAAVLRNEPTAEWFVIGGDDVQPDLNFKAEDLAYSATKNFGGTFGVWQPTGDRWGDSDQARKKYGADRGAYIDRVAGSAWIGREFARRAYGGTGPLWHEYRHMYVDEELQEVASMLGVFWARRDVTHLHQHWGRRPLAEESHRPPHLEQWNSAKHWRESRELFERRKAAGFPGHEPIT